MSVKKTHAREFALPKNLKGFDPPHSSLEWFAPAIEQWSKTHCSYADAFQGGDALYWFNERPNVGALAIAAWKAGMYAVEEYAAKKSINPVTKRSHPTTEKKSGRIDLYVADEYGNEAIFEAKQCWVNKATSKENMQGKMENALHDARCCPPDLQRVGLVFYVMKLKSTQVADEVLLNEVDRVRKTKPHALAWCFPGVNRQLVSDVGENPGYVWPGLIMSFRTA
jgi:hypothetical protein